MGHAVFELDSRDPAIGDSDLGNDASEEGSWHHRVDAPDVLLVVNCNAVERADALLYAIESCYLTFDILPDEMERANRGVQTFYALWDAVQSAREALDKLEGDRKVVDVIYAVNAIRRRDDDSTLTEED